MDDTTAAAAPTRGSVADTAETGGAVEEPAPETTTTGLIEYLQLTQPTVPSHPLPI